LPHVQAKGFSLVWVRSCRWKCSRRLKLLGQ
jgi:hypothetical protein